MSYPQGFEKVSIHAGKSGQWAINKFEVSEADARFSALRSAINHERHRAVPAGSYTSLTHGGGIVMSDTPAEAWEHRRLYNAAQGDVLLNGLGLGFALAAILRKKEVRSVTVIEKSPDVLALVVPHISDTRLTIIHDDAMLWRPKKGIRFDAVWHDIWPDICGDNKRQMTTLRRAYGRRCGWQSCWSEEYL